VLLDDGRSGDCLAPEDRVTTPFDSAAEPVEAS